MSLLLFFNYILVKYFIYLAISQDFVILLISANFAPGCAPLFLALFTYIALLSLHKTAHCFFPDMQYNRFYSNILAKDVPL